MVLFRNFTSLPVMVDSFTSKSSALECTRVPAFTEMVLESCVGEWHMNIMLSDRNEYESWRKMFPSIGSTLLGKFRSERSYFGDRVWLYYDDIVTCLDEEIVNAVACRNDDCDGSVADNTYVIASDNAAVAPGLVFTLRYFDSDIALKMREDR